MTIFSLSRVLIQNLAWQFFNKSTCQGKNYQGNVARVDAALEATKQRATWRF